MHILCLTECGDRRRLKRFCFYTASHKQIPRGVPQDMGTPHEDRAGGPGSLLDWGGSSGGYFANCWTWFASACVLHDCYLLCACTLSLKPLVPRSALLWVPSGAWVLHSWDQCWTSCFQCQPPQSSDNTAKEIPKQPWCAGEGKYNSLQAPSTAVQVSEQIIPKH